MKKCYALLMLLSCSIFVVAQSKFGNATKEELEMTSYENDTTASAVVLKKTGRIKFIVSTKGGFQYEYTEEKKVKILKPDGLNAVANNEIDYYVPSRNAKEEIKSLSGTTYNLENGKVVKTKLSKENIFEEDIDEKWKRRKFTMPAAKVGSVIEYKYTMVSDFIHDLRDFYYQEGIPVKEVDLETIIPEYLIYNLNNQGYVRMDEAKTDATNETYHFRYDAGAHGSFNEKVECSATRYIFKASNVPSAKLEAFLWTVNDYISKTTFELRSTNYPNSFIKSVTTNWESVDKELMDYNSFSGNLRHSGWFKDDIQAGDISLQRAAEIVEMIKGRMQWDRNNRLFSSSLKKSFESGVGSSADMNFLLINALNAGGFDAFPVILSTRANGRIPIVHPSISAFNYVITGVRIDDKAYFTDASSRFSVWNLLPEKCMVSQARMMSKGKGEWVDLSAISTNAIFKQGTLKFEDGKSIFSVKESYRGNPAYNVRNNYSTFESEEKFIQKIEDEESCEVSDFSITGFEDKYSALSIDITKSKDAILDEYMYISPPLTKLYTENPFKTETRIFPINFDYLMNYIQSVTIEVPEGYEVAEMPKSEQLILQDNALSFQYLTRQEENKIIIDTRYQVKTLLLLPSEYDFLKDFFAKMINKNNEQIVLKKIEIADL